MSDHVSAPSKAESATVKIPESLLDSSRQFVERTYAKVEGRLPNREAIEAAAKEIASVMHAVKVHIVLGAKHKAALK